MTLVARILLSRDGDWRGDGFLTELSWVQPYLAIGPRPDWPAWAALEQAGVSLIIDLNDDPVERRRARSVGLEYRGLKVPDPTGLEDFLAAFPRVHEWIERERTRGGRVYLHCTAGVYRSPTFAIGHLMARGEPGEKARNLVKEAHRPTWTSGDTETLERALQLWDKQLQLSHSTET